VNTSIIVFNNEIITNHHTKAWQLSSLNLNNYSLSWNKKWWYVDSKICNELDNTYGKVKKVLLQKKDDKQGNSAFPIGNAHFVQIFIKTQLIYFPKPLFKSRKFHSKIHLIIPYPKFHNSFTTFPKDAMSLANVLTKVVSYSHKKTTNHWIVCNYVPWIPSYYRNHVHMFKWIHPITNLQ
jgi:hypothetical protein